MICSMAIHSFDNFELSHNSIDRADETMFRLWDRLRSGDRHVGFQVWARGPDRLVGP